MVVWILGWFVLFGCFNVWFVVLACWFVLFSGFFVVCLL